LGGRPVVPNQSAHGCRSLLLPLSPEAMYCFPHQSQLPLFTRLHSPLPAPARIEGACRGSFFTPTPLLLQYGAFGPYMLGYSLQASAPLLVFEDFLPALLSAQFSHPYDRAKGSVCCAPQPSITLLPSNLDSPPLSASFLPEHSLVFFF